MRLLTIAILILSSVFADSNCTSNAESGNTTQKIDSLIPNDFEVLDLDSAYVNDDNCLDYLVALKKKNEEEGDFRPLLLVISENNLCDIQLEFRNDNALHSFLEGPYGGFDCFAGIELEKDSITINYYGGMSTRWSETHRFLFDKQLGKYLLTSIYLSSDNIYDDEIADEYEGNFDDENISLDTISIFRYSW